MSLTVVVSSSFTRPADTTQYGVGDLVANSTTAGDCLPLRFGPVVQAQGDAVRIEAARIFKSGTGVTAAAFRLHLWSVDPGTPGNGDNGALSETGTNYVGAIDVTIDRAWTDGAFGRGLPLTNTPMTSAPGGGGRELYGYLEARGAYTPASGETFRVTLEGYQL